MNKFITIPSIISSFYQPSKSINVSHLIGDPAMQPHIWYEKCKSFASMISITLSVQDRLTFIKNADYFITSSSNKSIVMDRMSFTVILSNIALNIQHSSQKTDCVIYSLKCLNHILKVYGHHLYQYHTNYMKCNDIQIMIFDILSIKIKSIYPETLACYKNIFTYKEYMNIRLVNMGIMYQYTSFSEMSFVDINTMTMDMCCFIFDNIDKIHSTQTIMCSINSTCKLFINMINVHLKRANYDVDLAIMDYDNGYIKTNVKSFVEDVDIAEECSVSDDVSCSISESMSKVFIVKPQDKKISHVRHSPRENLSDSSATHHSLSQHHIACTEDNIHIVLMQIKYYVKQYGKQKNNFLLVATETLNIYQKIVTRICEYVLYRQMTIRSKYPITSSWDPIELERDVIVMISIIQYEKSALQVRDTSVKTLHALSIIVSNAVQYIHDNKKDHKYIRSKLKNIMMLIVHINKAYKLKIPKLYVDSIVWKKANKLCKKTVYKWSNLIHPHI